MRRSTDHEAVQHANRGRRTRYPKLAVVPILAVFLFTSRTFAVYSPPAEAQRAAQAAPNGVVQTMTLPAGSTVNPIDTLKTLPYAPGRLIIKLKSSVNVCLDCLIAQHRPLAPALGSTRLDDLNRRYGLRSARPLRRIDATATSLPARRRRQSLRQQRLAALAVARTNRSAAPAVFTDFASTYVLNLSPWLDMKAVARAYAADPNVEYAEPDLKVKPLLMPNDQYFATSGSWGQPFADLWGIKLIDAPAAWDTTQGDGVVVAVIDTGLDTAHPDIAANVWVNPGEGSTPDGIDNDSNGFVDDINGWNFVTNTNFVNDDFGHGTHVAGIIAAVGQNGIGVIGVAFHAKIMALKGLDSQGYGFTSNLADAILYAADNHANVINASWGGTGTSQSLDDAIATATGAGVVFVASAGNSNTDVNAPPPYGPFFPAANPHVITVSAFDHTDTKAFFSNFGAKIDVAAPGGGDSGTGFDPFRSVLSLRASGVVPEMTGNGKLIVGGQYLRQAGTSMAAPYVAGAAALVLATHPSDSPAQVRQALRAGADDVDTPGYDFNSGYGRINVARSISLNALAAEIDDPATGFVATGTSVPIAGSASGSGFVSHTLEYGSGQLPTTWTTFAGPTTTPVDNGPLTTWDISAIPDGPYVIRLHAQNAEGADFVDRVAITLDHVFITAPQEATIIRPDGPLEIRGTASGAGFQGFHLEWRVTTPDYVTGPWRTDGFTLSGGGTAPVSDDLLGTFDTSLLTGNTDVDFRLVVTQAGVDKTKEVHHVVLDPTLRAGWPQTIAELPVTSTAQVLMNQVTIADLEGDGTKDIIVAYGDMVYVFRPDGTPLPGWPQRLVSGIDPTRTAFARRSPAVGDLDGDGRPEIVVGADWELDSQGSSYYGATYVFHADGTLAAGWPKYLTDAYGTGSVGDYVLADINGDGRRDIISVVGGSIEAMDVNGNMLSGWPVQFTECYFYSQTYCMESLLAVGDVNGDGKKEIAAVSRSPKNNLKQVLLLYSATGSLMPGFPRPLGHIYGWGAQFTLYPWEQAIPNYINGPIMADVDGDGKLEIIALTNGMRVRVYRSNGRRVFTRPGRTLGLPNRQCGNRRGGIATLPPILEPPTAGDLTGDGQAEVVVASHTKSWKARSVGHGIRLYLCPEKIHSTDYINALRAGSSGSSVDGWPIAIPYANAIPAYGPGSVAIGDIDGDLQPDVVSGSGICVNVDPVTIPYSPGAYRCFTVSAYDHSGNLLPGFPKATPGPGSVNTMTPAIGDLAGDGLKEIVWIDWYGNVLVWNVPGTPAPENMQWPMFRHDPAHTAALVPNP